MRYLLLVLVMVGFAASSRADMITLDLPSTYTPGTSFNVGVGLEPVNNLALYNVEVVFRVTGPVLGNLTVDTPTAASSNYVFPSTAFFLGNTNTTGSEFRVVLSDFDLGSGVNVVAGVNDKLSTLTVRPSASLTGNIEVFIDRTSLFLDDASSNSLITNGPLPSGIVTQSGNSNPVPAPAGIVGLLTAIGLVALRRFKQQKTAEA